FFEKSYKVVGILSDDGALAGKSYGGAIDVFTAADFSKNAQHSKYYNYNDLYLNFTESAERDYIRVTSEITGIDEKYVDGIETGFFDRDEDSEEAYKQLKKANFGIEMFNINNEVLHYKGLALSESSSQILFGIASFVIVIILISSVFIIRNSFAISITEKTKLYGMLSSTGATPRQIRHNVLFEAFILGLIGIPLGIGLGVGATAVLILICNTLLNEALNGFSLVFAVEPYAIIASVLLGIITIFFSAIIIALRASRIPLIEAIRSSNDIRVKKSKRYKTPKLISVIFGIGGSIAWKNLKRSRKRYRTTVISIVVSVTVFLAVFSLTQSMVSYSRLYYQEVDYNLIVSENIKPETAERAREFTEVDKAVYRNEVSSYCIRVPVNRLVTGIEDKNICYWTGREDYKEWLSEDGKSVDLMLSFTTLDQSSYRELIKILGYDYDDIKNKGIIANYAYLFDKAGYNTKNTTQLFSSTEGMRLKGYNDEGIKHSTVSIEIGGEFNSPEKLGKFKQIIGGESLIVSPEWFAENTDIENNIYNDIVFINSSDADKTEQALTEIYDGLYMFNNEKQMRIMNAFVLVIQIFVYGFILVISLIGLTNIFNTITTNMRLRNKEFAMLRSVGMTDREFNRMIRLESLLYTVKSLMFGIPLGLIGGYIAYRVFETNNVEITYTFPWIAIVISIVAVMLVVWMIMRFSIGKVRKQNIIETIRNDNI
ncbi:MAG: ABC transporter permease, partial [Ruminococcus sp.]|nr:ABC transporter permease [Ruminococcus sp.]